MLESTLSRVTVAMETLARGDGCWRHAPWLGVTVAMGTDARAVRHRGRPSLRSTAATITVARAVLCGRGDRSRGVAVPGEGGGVTTTRP